MTAELTFVDHMLIPVDDGSARWVDVRQFQLPPLRVPDVAALSLLLAHERFRGGNGLVHGPYRLERVTLSAYHPITAPAALATLRGWASGEVAEEVHAELESSVYPLITAATSRYRLRDLGPSAWHAGGSALGGYHELILIDASQSALALVVASND